MNVWLTLEAKNADTWAMLLPKIRFYQEETALRVEEAGEPIAKEQELKGSADVSPLIQSIRRSSEKQVGVKFKCSEPDAHRLFDIFTKAGLIGALSFKIERILPQDDPAEKEILSKLYRGGDTSEKPPEPVEREVKTDSASFYLTKEEYAEYMRGMGRRAS